MNEKRKLSTVLFADIVGYTSLMQTDEKRAMLFLNHFKELIEKIVPLHQGEIIQYYGDAVLLTFDSSKDGVDCSISLQEAFIKEEVPIRIGMHLGDVIFKNDNVFGDGVNIASRIESMGIPGGILISKAVRDQLSNKSEFILTSMGSYEFKNVKEPIEVFAMAIEGLVVPTRADLKGKGKQVKQKRPMWKSLTAVIAQKGYGPALHKIKRLVDRYPQSAEFVRKYGLYLYDGNTYFGGSCTEGKPYLLKAMELDPIDKRPIHTLTKIAVIESDSAAIQHYLSIVDTTMGMYPYLKLAEFMFMDTVSDQQIKAFMDVYGSKIGWLYVTHQLPENEVVNLSLIARLLEARPDRFSTLAYKEIKFGSSGQEKKLLKLFQNSPITGGLDIQWYGRCLPATFMGNDGFTPYSEHYDSLYIQTKDGKTPWELYAALKYALTLNLPEEAKVLKNKIRHLGNDQALNKVVRYYDFSVQAFEARLAENDDLALTYIDSAYQYMFAPFWIEGMVSRLDKTIMAANIYANKGDYEKAISLYNPSQYGAGIPTFRGYASYQLSNWYEQIGDVQNSLTKSNLFLESYENCDEKYQPWVEEVEARRDRLISRMN